MAWVQFSRRFWLDPVYRGSPEAQVVLLSSSWSLRRSAVIDSASIGSGVDPRRVSAPHWRGHA